MSFEESQKSASSIAEKAAASVQPLAQVDLGGRVKAIGAPRASPTPAERPASGKFKMS
jgi:hypothetical protein